MCLLSGLLPHLILDQGVGQSEFQDAVPVRQAYQQLFFFRYPLEHNSSPVLLPPPHGWAWFKGMQDAKKSQLWLGRNGLVCTATEVETFGLLSVEIKI